MFEKNVSENIILTYGRIIIKVKIAIKNSLFKIAFCIFHVGHFKSTIFVYAKVFHKFFSFQKHHFVRMFIFISLRNTCSGNNLKTQNRTFLRRRVKLSREEEKNKKGRVWTRAECGRKKRKRGRTESTEGKRGRLGFLKNLRGAGCNKRVQIALGKTSEDRLNVSLSSSLAL